MERAGKIKVKLILDPDYNRTIVVYNGQEAKNIEELTAWIERDS